MKTYYFEYEYKTGQRCRKKDVRTANSKSHLMRILTILKINFIKNTIKEIK